jgi:hypothetical protein
MSMVVMVPSTGTMGLWSLPLVPYGGFDYDGDVGEHDVAGLQRGLAGSNGGLMPLVLVFFSVPCFPPSVSLLKARVLITCLITNM